MIEFVGEKPQTVWMPVLASATVYVGSIVGVDHSALGDGVVVRDQADGAANTTNLDRPLGVCVGTNLKTPLYSSTYLCEYITAPAVTSIRTNNTEYRMVEGQWTQNSKRAMVEIALITPSTVLRAPLRNAAIGTSITELTSSGGNANGLTVTTDACDFTPVAGLASIYCRSGVNAGQYRITTDVSATIAAWANEMLNTTVTTGETYVRVPVRTHGESYVRFGDDTVCSFIDASQPAATDYDIIHVISLDLTVAGREVVTFMFNSDAFTIARA